jgi:hypothetical protein
MSKNEDLGDTEPRGISRRTVAIGAAWAVPVIALATASPAFASSGIGPTLKFISACKNPGGSCKTRVKGYSFFFDVTNSSGKDIYIYSPVTYTIVSGSVSLSWAQGSPPLPALVPAGQTIQIEFVATSTNSANQAFGVQLTVPWGHTLPNGSDTDHQPIVTPTVNVPGTPPDCNCPD